MGSGDAGVLPGSAGNNKRCRQEGGFRAIVRNRHGTVVPDFLLRYGVAVGPRWSHWRRTSSARLFGEMLLIE